jgi:uncharacterized repeat protein (TIGR01451 family)
MTMKKRILQLLAATTVLALTSMQTMAAIAFVQNIGYAGIASTSGVASSIMIPVTTAVAKDDLIVLTIGFSGLQGSGIGPNFTITPSDSRGNTYLTRGVAQTGFGITFQSADILGTATTALQPGDHSTLSFTPSQASTPYTALAAALEFSGASTTSDGNKGEATPGGVSQVDTAQNGLLATTNANDLVFGFLAVPSTAVTGLSQTTEPPFETPSAPIQSNGITLLPMYSIATTTGTYSIEGTINGISSPFPPFIATLHAVTTGVAETTNANLTLTKTHLDPFIQRDVGETYTLTVTNTGMTATSGAITITDTLPTGLSFFSATANSWPCSPTVPGGSTIVCDSGGATIAAGKNSIITFLVSVAADAPLKVTNTASVACIAPCTSSNPASNPAVDPTNITPLVLPPPPPVAALPMLDDRGLDALLIALSAAAWLALRRRNVERK